MNVGKQDKATAAKPADSAVVRLNFLKLFIRSGLFIAVAAVHLSDKQILVESIYGNLNAGTLLLVVIWIVFVVEMVPRFFPSKYESMGSQKQFANNIIENDIPLGIKGNIKTKHFRQVISVAAAWIVLNAGVGGLYFGGIINEGGLLVISLFYAVSDIICILFYCPFQSLIMKNRCCVSCRIYNWDFLMMFTPLLFIRSWYTLSLAGIALLLFIKWEAACAAYPERFCEETNPNLACSHCREKLCVYKTGGLK